MVTSANGSVHLSVVEASRGHFQSRVIYRTALPIHQGKGSCSSLAADHTEVFALKQESLDLRTLHCKSCNLDCYYDYCKFMWLSNYHFFHQSLQLIISYPYVHFITISVVFKNKSSFTLYWFDEMLLNFFYVLYLNTDCSSPHCKCGIKLK